MANSKFGSWREKMERREGRGRRKEGRSLKIPFGILSLLDSPKSFKKTYTKDYTSLSCMCNCSSIGRFQLSFILAPSLICISWDPYCISGPCWAADENSGINSWEEWKLIAVEWEGVDMPWREHLLCSDKIIHIIIPCRDCRIWVIFFSF